MIGTAGFPSAADKKKISPPLIKKDLTSEDSELFSHGEISFLHFILILFNKKKVIPNEN